ncbi:MAG TPA: cobalamin-independent methionine synthase II family protein [Bryobacteraceae bacterium]|jgi:5-methyltetrahydropteroyltriglutamate--homocysteine methyltransferase|nr:cobalamin-independent methionine synthase II family protein [Bryobacteraceae bacterium]
MKRSEHRILTTHVGSLIRPQELRELAAAAEKDSAQTERYYMRLRESVGDVVKHQAQVGIDIVSDGEYGKQSWATYILKRISGFEIRPNQIRTLTWLGRDRERFREAIAQDLPRLASGVPTEACVAPIAYRDREPICRNIENFQAALSAVSVEEGFLTAVAPASTAYDGINEYYATEKEYIYAIADALREEYLAIYNAGLLLQVDDAVLANMYDELVQKSPERYREWANLRVEALNHALQGIPEERVRYHVCFGSWHVPHVSDAPLEDIVDLIVKVRAGAYSIEAANVRHEHEWRVWENARLPAGRVLIPGVITHHTVTVEHPQLVADRIIRFAGLVGRENVIAGTDCGFAQAEMIQRVHPTVMWAKFESLVEGARLASKALWR